MERLKIRSNKKALAEAITPITATLLLPTKGSVQLTCVRLKMEPEKAKIINKGINIFMLQRYSITRVVRC